MAGKRIIKGRINAQASIGWGERDRQTDRETGTKRERER